MFRNMVTSFLTHERIVTTDAKAKELRPIAEKLITLGKQGDLHSVRQASSYIRDKKTVTKLFSVIAPRYKERAGGYTRIVKLGMRQGDTAELSVIELVEEQIQQKSSKKPEKKKVAVKVEPPVSVEASASVVEDAEEAKVETAEKKPTAESDEA